MATWDDRISNHALGGALARLDAAATSLVRSDSANTTAIADIGRIRAIVALARRRLSELDSQVAPLSALTGMETATEVTIAALQAHAQSTDPASFDQVLSAADDILALLPQLGLPPATKRDFAASTDRAREYKRTLDAYIETAEAAHRRFLAEVASARENVAREVASTVTNLSIKVEEALALATSEAAATRASLVADVKNLSDSLRGELSLIRTKLTTDTDSQAATMTAALTAQKESVDALAREVAAERQRLGSLVSDHQTQFATAQDSRAREWSEQQKERGERLAALFSEHSQRLASLAADQQAQFTAAQDTRNRDWDEAQRDRQGKFGSIVEDSGQRLQASLLELAALRDDSKREHAALLAELRAGFVAKADEMQREMQARKEKLEQLLGVIGVLGVTSGYQTAASEAKVTTRVWQVIAVGAMGGFIWFANKAFLPTLQGDFKWPTFAGRVFVSLSVAVMAAYAASQADRYQRVERQTKKTALDLAAFEPFVAGLSSDKQQEMRAALGERSFGHGEFGVGGAHDASPATVVDLLLQSKEFNALLVAAAKAARPT